MLYEDIRCYVGCKECANCIVVCNPIGTENETSSFGTTLHLNQTNLYSILLVFESNTDIFRDIAKSPRKLKIIFTRVKLCCMSVSVSELCLSGSISVTQ